MVLDSLWGIEIISDLAFNAIEDLFPQMGPFFGFAFEGQLAALDLEQF